jgi:hypothetical protein
MISDFWAVAHYRRPFLALLFLCRKYADQARTKMKKRAGLKGIESETYADYLYADTIVDQVLKYLDLTDAQLKHEIRQSQGDWQSPGEPIDLGFMSNLRYE